MSRPIKIIHLEDSSFDAEIIERELSISSLKFERTWVTNKEDFRKALMASTPDIVLSDHSLPSFSSTQALKMLAEMNISVPFILITGAISEEFAVNILKEGASDYLLKDHMQRLPEAISDCLKKWETRKQEKEHMQTLAARESRLSNMMDQLKSGVLLIDKDLNILYSNKTFRMKAGFSKDEEKTLNHVIHGQDLEQIKRMLKDLTLGDPKNSGIRMLQGDSARITRLEGNGEIFMLEI